MPDEIIPPAPKLPTLAPEPTSHPSDLQVFAELLLKVVIAVIVAAAWLVYKQLSTEFAIMTLGSLASIHLAGNSKRLKGVGFTAVGALLAAGLGTGCASLPPLTSEDLSKHTALVRQASALVCKVLGKENEPACLYAPATITIAEAFIRSELVK